MIRLFIISLFALMLASCASQSVREAHLGKDMIYSLPQNPWTGKSLTSFQQVTLEYDTVVFHFQAIIDLHPGLVKIALIDMTGRRAADINWSENNIDIIKADWLPDAVNAEEIVARLVLAFWPIEMAKIGLPKTAILLDEGYSRRVITEGKTLINISRNGDNPWTSKTVIDQQDNAFKLVITSSLREVK